MKLAEGSSPEAWTAHYRRSTVSFGVVQQAAGKDVFQVIGTGVVISPDPHFAYFVTAKHIFSDPTQGWHPTELRVRFADEETKSFSEDLGRVVLLQDARGRDLWSSLKDGSDIAGIPVSGSFADIVTDAIGYGDFAQADDVYDGASVFVFGYPSDSQALIGENGLVRAITRSGIVAWTDPTGALDHPLLLDSNILPGNSGGPAFKVPSGLNKFGTFAVGDRVAFLGIVTSTLQRYYSAAVVVTGVGGLGRVEPAFKVKMLVELLRSSVPQ